MFNDVHSITAFLDKRLRVDVAILREMIGKGEIKKVTWYLLKINLQTVSQKEEALL